MWIVISDTNSLNYDFIVDKLISCGYKWVATGSGKPLYEKDWLVGFRKDNKEIAFIPKEMFETHDFSSITSYKLIGKDDLE